MSWGRLPQFRTPRTAILLSLFAAGCGTGPANVDDPLTCFPPEARRWIHVASQEDPAAAPAPARSAATIYVDRSGSMSGYLAGASEEERPLHDLIGNLPAMLSRQNLSVGYKAFGRNISAPIPAAAGGTLMVPGFYACTNADSATCDNQESRLDNVFREIAGSRGEMAVVITDLWFSNSDIATSALSALAEPLTEILANGRAVAVYGIAAPFEGRIYDLPRSASPVAFDGRHPLFVIAVGSDDQIADLHEAWLRSPSPHLAQGLSSGAMKRTLFTLSPARNTEALARPLGDGSAPGLTETPVLEVRENLEIQEFALNADSALRAEGAGNPPAWIGPDPDAFVADSVWQGQFQPRVRVWERRGHACVEGDWLESNAIRGMWSDTEEGKRRFVLAPEILASELRSEGTYLIVPELVRTKLQTPSPASEWIRRWGFTPSDSDPVTRGEGGPLFRTLHLGEVARLLENALAVAAEREPGPLFGFAAAVRVER